MAKAVGYKGNDPTIASIIGTAGCTFNYIDDFKRVPGEIIEFTIQFTNRSPETEGNLLSVLGKSITIKAPPDLRHADRKYPCVIFQ